MAKEFLGCSIGVNAFTGFTDVHQTTLDDGYIVTGYTAASPGSQRDVLLMKTNSNGNLQWFKTYGEQFSESGYNCAESQDPPGNPDYLVTGFTKAPGEGGGTFLLRTNSIGNLLHNRTYRFFNGGQAMYETANGDVIISGQATDFATIHEPSLLHVDGAAGASFGNLNWCKAYNGSGPGGGTGESVAITHGGEFQLAAWTSSFGGIDNDIYTVRTNAQGESGCNERSHNVILGDEMLTEECPEIEVLIC